MSFLSSVKSTQNNIFPTPFGINTKLLILPPQITANTSRAVWTSHDVTCWQAAFNFRAIWFFQCFGHWKSFSNFKSIFRQFFFLWNQKRMFNSCFSQLTRLFANNWIFLFQLLSKHFHSQVECMSVLRML